MKLVTLRTCNLTFLEFQGKDNTNGGSKSSTEGSQKGGSSDQAAGSPPIKRIKVSPPPLPVATQGKAGNSEVTKTYKKSPLSKSLATTLAKTMTNSERFDGLLSSPMTKPPTPPKTESVASQPKKVANPLMKDLKDHKLTFTTTTKSEVKVNVGEVKKGEGCESQKVVKDEKKLVVPDTKMESSVGSNPVKAVSNAAASTKPSVVTKQPAAPVTPAQPKKELGKTIIHNTSAVHQIMGSAKVPVQGGAKAPVQSAKAPVQGAKSAVPVKSAAQPADKKPVKPEIKAEDEKKPKVEQSQPTKVLPKPPTSVKSVTTKPEPKKEFKDAIGNIVREITKKDVDKAIIKADTKTEIKGDIKVNIVTKAEASAKSEKKEPVTKVQSVKAAAPSSGSPAPSNPKQAPQVKLSTIVSNLAKKQQGGESKSNPGETKKPEAGKKESESQLTKSIPSGTTITVKQVPVSSANAGGTATSGDTKSDQQKEKALISIESTSIGNTSLKHFVSQNKQQTASPGVAGNKITTTSDLRQFRKPSQSTPSTTANGTQAKPSTPVTASGLKSTSGKFAG